MYFGKRPRKGVSEVMGAILLILVVVVAVASLAAFIAVAEKQAQARSTVLTSIKDEDVQVVNVQFEGSCTVYPMAPNTSPGQFTCLASSPPYQNYWGFALLTLRNANTQPVQITEIKVANSSYPYWVPGWYQTTSSSQVQFDASTSAAQMFGATNTYFGIPARGTLAVLLNLTKTLSGVNVPVPLVVRNDSFTITLLTEAGNFFTSYYKPPTAAFSQSVIQTPYESTTRDQIELDGSPSTNGNATIQSYIWNVEVTPDGWKPSEGWSASGVQSFSATGQIFIYQPQDLYPTQLTTLNETGPILVTLTVVDGNGLMGSTEPTVISGDPLVAPVASISLLNVENMGTCCSATLTVTLKDIFGNPASGQVVDFELVSGNITSITPITGVTNSSGEASAVIAYGGQGGVVMVVSEGNSALKLQQVEGGSLAVTITPQNPTADSGESVTLTANPSGGKPTYTYQWYSNSGCTTSGAISGATSSTYSASSTTTTTYCVKVTDSVGGTATATDTVTINSALEAGAITPASPLTIDNGQTITLASHASGGIGPYSYQWYSDGTCTTAISSATSSTYAASPTMNTIYSYEVTDSESQSACSTGDTVTVDPALVVPTPTVNYNPVDAGQQVMFAVSPSGGSGLGTYTYAWSGLPAGCTSANLATITCSPTAAGTYSVTVAVTDSNDNTVTSALAFTVNSALTVQTPTPSSQTIDQGQKATITDSAPTTGTSPYVYQWLVEAPGASSFTDATGCYLPTPLTCSFATSSSTVSGTYSFELQVTDSSGSPSTVASSPVKVTVNGELTQPTIMASAVTSSAVTLTTTGFSGGTPAYTCQWLEEAPGTTGYSPLTSSSSCQSLTTYGTSALTLTPGTWLFEFEVTDSSAVTMTSPPLACTTSVSLVTCVSISPSAPEIDSGQSVTLAATASGGSGPGTYSYQWYSNSGCTATISGATASTYSASPTSTTTYCVEVTDTSSDMVTAADTVTVNGVLTLGSITPSAPTIDSGQSISLSASWTGGTSTFTVTWYSGSSPMCSSDTTVVATNSGLTASPNPELVSPTASTYYCAVITDSSPGAPPPVTDAAIEVTVDPALVVPAPTVSSNNIAPDTSVTFTAGPSGGSGIYTTYAWSGLPAGCTGINSATITCSPTAAGTYIVTVAVTDSNGNTVTSLGLSFTVLDPPSDAPAQPPTGALVWSANFDTGDFTQWNYCCDSVGGGMTNISSHLAHTGVYSEYAWNPGDTGSLKRAYPAETFSPGISDFLVNMWIYVPRDYNGVPVSITDWVSFLSLWINPGYWQYAAPITIDGGQQLQMDLEMFTTPVYVYQTNPINWPYNQWFELSVSGVLDPGGTSYITVYQNNATIMSWEGVLPDTGTGTLGTGPVTYSGLTQIHAGLYIGPAQSYFSIYNADFTVYNTASYYAPAVASSPLHAAELQLGLAGIPLLFFGRPLANMKRCCEQTPSLLYRRVRINPLRCKGWKIAE